MTTMGLLKRCAVTALGALVAFVGVAGGWIAWQLMRDPLAALPREPAGLRIVSEQRLARADAAREHRRLVLASTGGETV
ncbi:MAG: hypothetical protein IIA73_05670, partial [Proteobacteria bacterium]|nr:hypothetical protein [Pseudomonadota bacterium]